MRKKHNTEEQLTQILHTSTRPTFRTSTQLIAQRRGAEVVHKWWCIAQLLGVADKTLREAYKRSPVLQRLILKPRSRVSLNLRATSDLDWDYLQTMLIIHARGSVAKSSAAYRRERKKRRFRVAAAASAP